jgi:hypothetical protein
MRWLAIGTSGVKLLRKSNGTGVPPGRMSRLGVEETCARVELGGHRKLLHVRRSGLGSEGTLNPCQSTGS